MKKKFWKKAAALAMAASFMVTAAGCGGSSDTAATSSGDSTASASGDIPTVSFVCPTFYDVSQAQTVEDAINAVTADKYGVKLKFTYVEGGNWTQQSNMLLTGDEADIIMVFGTPLLTYAKNGQLADLTDYYANASEEFKSATAGFMDDEILKCTSVSGKLYGLPNFRNQGDTVVLEMTHEIAEQYGLTGGQSLTLDEVDELLGKIHADYPDKYAIVPQGQNNMTNGDWTWDGLGDKSFVGVVNIFEDDTTVKNLFETEEFKDFTKHSRYWYEQGYMMADCLSNTEGGEALIDNDRAVTTINNGNWYTDENFVQGKYTRVVICQPKAMTTTINGMCWAISANSKNKDAAWKMMEALYMDEDVIKLLVNGVEGSNYVLTDDGLAAFPEGTDYNNCGYAGMQQLWAYPNSGLAYIREDLGASYNDDLNNYNKNVHRGTGFGFCFDTTNVTDEYSACVNVMSKYYQALLMGAVDPDETIPQALEEFEAAGIDKVIAEKQSQFDAWLAENK